MANRFLLQKKWSQSKTLPWYTALQDPDQDSVAHLCSGGVQNCRFDFFSQYNREVGTRVCGEPAVQPWVRAQAQHGLVLTVCSPGLVERWQHRVCIALKKALTDLLSGVGGFMEYFLTLKKLTLSFFLFLFFFGGMFFPQVSEEEVMITVRAIARDFPYLGTVVTSP